MDSEANSVTHIVRIPEYKLRVIERRAVLSHNEMTMSNKSFVEGDRHEGEAEAESEI